MADKAEFTEAEAQTFTVRLSEAVDRDVTVTLDGGNTVTIIAGETETTYTRPAQGDDVFNDGETVTVELESAAASDGTAFENVTLGDAADGRHRRHHRHRDRHHPECRRLQRGRRRHRHLHRHPNGPQGADLTGHNGLEFRLADGSTVTIAAGQLSGSTTVTAADDAFVGGQDTLVNRIDAVLNNSDSEFENLVTAGNTSVTVTDEPGTTPGNPGDPGTPNGGDGITVSIVADKAEFTEAEAQTFTVRLSEAVDRDVTVTLDGGNTVTIIAGETETIYTRPAQGDDVFNDGETVTVELESAAASDGTAFENVTLGDAAKTQVVDTIDTVTATLSADASSVAEAAPSPTPSP
ncbi:immunoglobulin-like domain-containing protein [Vreelandella piezotolerans]|uniref:immunoglobulin-like domain-containing protein n=1 Tax=Vreelandella piezotolerans TaxID=2609667 RepID=UPI002F2B4D9D